jgi:hypothetical protein
MTTIIRSSIGLALKYVRIGFIVAVSKVPGTTEIELSIPLTV